MLSIFLKVLTLGSAFSVSSSSDVRVQNVLKRILSKYDPKLRPNYLGSPVQVRVDATILSLTNLDAINSMYTFDMFFRQQWQDHRLKHELNEGLVIVVGTKHPSDIIWVPDTVFINSVTSKMHHVTVNNHKLDIEPDGRVFWGSRITVSPICYLDLRAYPMDRQECEFRIVSYAYDSQHLKYEWKMSPGMKIIDEKMAQFELVHYETEGVEKNFVAGNYTVLKGRFKFKRLMGFAVLQIYVPAIAIVCVSWISLWIKRLAIPARVSLCITTLLTISTIWASVNSTLPRVNYVKAVDIFLMMSFCCVIATLLEYTVVLNCPNIVEVVKNRMQKRQKAAMATVENIGMSSNNSRETIQLTEVKKLNGEDEGVAERARNERLRNDRLRKEMILEEAEVLADKIELFARFFFPGIYIIFNVFYWTTFLSGDKHAISTE